MASDTKKAGLSQLHELTMLDHVQAKLEMGRKHLDHYRRKGLEMPIQESSEDDMRIISLGDVRVENPPPTPAATGLSGLAKAGIAAALIGSGAGMGLALPSLLDGRSQPVESPPPEVIRESQTIERDYQIGEITVE